jgi:hypothetical protein
MLGVFVVLQPMPVSAEVSGPVLGPPAAERAAGEAEPEVLFEGAGCAVCESCEAWGC